MKFPEIGERQWVTIGIFATAWLLLGMGWLNPALWGVEVFKVIIQAVVLTGLLNMVLAFHFSSNKGAETARENTGLAFKAIKATADAGTAPVTDADAAASAARATADAAGDKADDFEAKADAP